MFKLTIFKQNKFQFFSFSDFTTQLICVAHCLIKEEKKTNQNKNCIENYETKLKNSKKNSKRDQNH